MGWGCGFCAREVVVVVVVVVVIAVRGGNPDLSEREYRKSEKDGGKQIISPRAVRRAKAP